MVSGIETYHCLAECYLFHFSQITDVMAIKILLNEGAVVPISGRICDGCMESYVSVKPKISPTLHGYFCSPVFLF